MCAVLLPPGVNPIAINKYVKQTSTYCILNSIPVYTLTTKSALPLILSYSAHFAAYPFHQHNLLPWRPSQAELRRRLCVSQFWDHFERRHPLPVHLLHFKFRKIQAPNGDRGSTVVKVLCYKSEGRWFDPRWCHLKLSLA